MCVHVHRLIKRCTLFKLLILTHTHTKLHYYNTRIKTTEYFKKSNTDNTLYVSVL